MKHLISIGILITVCFIGELLHLLLPLPVPASIYGLLLMLFLLLTGFIKIKQMEQTARFFLSVMPVFFLEPAVRLMNSFSLILENLLPILCICFFSTVIVFTVTGIIAQWLCCHTHGKKR